MAILFQNDPWPSRLKRVCYFSYFNNTLFFFLFLFFFLVYYRLVSFLSLFLLQIYKVTYEHATTLASFVFVYKGFLFFFLTQFNGDIIRTLIDMSNKN